MIERTTLYSCSFFKESRTVPDLLLYSGETEQVRRETKVMRILSLANQPGEIS
jgi:hypothetical protein